MPLYLPRSGSKPTFDQATVTEQTTVISSVNDVSVDYTVTGCNVGFFSIPQGLLRIVRPFGRRLLPTKYDVRNGHFERKITVTCL